MIMIIIKSCRFHIVKHGVNKIPYHPIATRTRSKRSRKVLTQIGIHFRQPVSQEDHDQEFIEFLNQYAIKTNRKHEIATVKQELFESSSESSSDEDDSNSPASVQPGSPVVINDIKENNKSTLSESVVMYSPSQPYYNPNSPVYTPTQPMQDIDYHLSPSDPTDNQRYSPEPAQSYYDQPYQPVGICHDNYQLAMNTSLPVSMILFSMFYYDNSQILSHV